MEWVLFVMIFFGSSVTTSTIENFPSYEACTRAANAVIQTMQSNRVQGVAVPACIQRRG